MGKVIAQLFEANRNKWQVELSWKNWTMYTEPHRDKSKVIADAEAMAGRLGGKIEWYEISEDSYAK